MPYRLKNIEIGELGDWRIGKLEDLRFNLNYSRFGDWGVGEMGACRIGGLEYYDILGFKSVRK